jgi:putative NADPH-quinone reductase
MSLARVAKVRFWIGFFIPHKYRVFDCGQKILLTAVILLNMTTVNINESHKETPMPIRRIFVLNGHPAASSLSKAMSEAYAQAAKTAGHEVRIMHLHDLDFDMDYGFAGYANNKPLEPDLENFQANVDWAQHVVLTTPMWWGGLPAKLKGLIDRAFLPGWAFDTRTLKMGMPAPMLKGRTARAIVTSDTPNLFFGLLYRKALFRQIKGQIFHFVGLKPTKITHFAPASKAGPDQVNPWIKTVESLARRAI